MGCIPGTSFSSVYMNKLICKFASFSCNLFCARVKRRVVSGEGLVWSLNISNVPIHMLPGRCAHYKTSKYQNICHTSEHNYPSCFAS